MQRESWEWIKWPESIMMWIFADLFVSWFFWWRDQSEMGRMTWSWKRRRRKRKREESFWKKKEEELGKFMDWDEKERGWRGRKRDAIFSYEPRLCTKVKRLEGEREKKRQDLESLSSSGRERNLSGDSRETYTTFSTVRRKRWELEGWRKEQLTES